MAGRWTRSRAWQLLGWAIAALVALVSVLGTMRWAAQRQLETDTEHAAIGYARYLSDTVPDLDAAFAGRGFSAEALVELRRVRRLGDVFRFKLFDRHGALLLVSDDLDKAQPAAAPEALKGYVRQRVLEGRIHVGLKQGTPPQRPALFSEAYVPVQRGGALLGIVEVYVDQTARQRSIQRAFVIVASTVSLVLGALATGSALTWWRRLRAQQEAQRRVEYLAQYDVLSGTLNRASFHEALRRAVWRAPGGGAVAVLCVDVDHFKEINDGHGHAVGDEVLRQVGARLRGLVRQGDLVARLGGDEFAVLQSGVGSPDGVTRLAQRIVQSLGEPFACGMRSVRCGASVGAAILGDDARDGAALLHQADLALYRAKALGRGCFSFYDAALDRQLQQRRELTHDLRQAVDNDELQLHFQPLYETGADRDAAVPRLVGYEALLRWMHPTRGAVPPMTFIPLAEEVGLIDRIGRWVLRRACCEAAQWPAPLSVAVNLSAAQFRRDDPALAVREALDASGLAATRLEVEITESLLMSNTEAVVATLHRLSAMGVRIAMDDFGTGYSSLAYLWRYPFDKVKIDRSFVHGLESDPKVNLIVKSIIGLAHSMDIRVNAEGVETRAQLEWLRQHGCDELQGFLLGRPAPVSHLDHGESVEPSPPTLPLPLLELPGR